jgi:peptide subunit release factor 1 (eRF1)
MMPMTRQEIEVLLDTPDQLDYVVSAYADMTVKNGFSRDVELHLKTQAKAAAEALAQTKARKDLEANLDLIRQIVADNAGAPCKGLAIFSSLSRGLRHVVPLDFEVENRLVIDEEPYFLPILEHWYGQPAYLIVLLDSDQAHLFTAHRGQADWVRDIERQDAHEVYQRDKPRFTYKKRFARAQHERLHALEDDGFFRTVAGAVAEEWGRDHFGGLILLGQQAITASLRRLLPRDLEQMVAGESPHAMTTRPEDVSDDVGRILDQWRTRREAEILAELHERWRRNHLVADGPGDVLGALQQGRVRQVVIGTRRDLVGARCSECGYRFGEPVATCVYCQAACERINAVQEILRMAIRHRVPVHLFRQGLKTDPLAPGGVAALLVAAPNWAPKAAGV